MLILISFKEIYLFLCKNTYMVKEKMIHAYRTKNCEVREVTKEDVKKDIDDFRKSGQTEAAILTHSTIIDLLDDCHAALNAGYSWDYKAPDQGNCKRSNVE
jgi:hypothetical protein